MSQVTLKIDGLNNRGCVKTITKAIQSTDPGLQVTIDLDTGKTTITGPGDLPPTQELLAAIFASGYDASAPGEAAI